MPVMNDYAWIAEESGKVTGILLAAPCHGLAFIMRICTEKGVSGMTLQLMFRKFIQDCRARDLRGYFTFIDPGRDAERRFIPICEKAGGMQIQTLQVGLVGSIEKAAKY